LKALTRVSGTLITRPAQVALTARAEGRGAPGAPRRQTLRDRVHGDACEGFKFAAG
jgi:hypothetical protein